MLNEVGRRKFGEDSIALLLLKIIETFYFFVEINEILHLASILLVKSEILLRFNVCLRVSARYFTFLLIHIFCTADFTIDFKPVVMVNVWVDTIRTILTSAFAHL